MKIRILLVLALIFTVMAVSAQDEEMMEDDLLGVVVQQATSGEFDGETLTLNGVLPVASIIYYDDEDEVAFTQTATAEMLGSWQTYATIGENEPIQFYVTLEVFNGNRSENYQATLMVQVNQDAQFDNETGVVVYDVIEVMEIVNILDEADDKAELPESFEDASLFVVVDEANLAAWQEGYQEWLNTARPGGSAPTCSFIC